jgi:hypothetical protein
MGIVTATTGHSQPQERRVANWLYAAIGIAVVLAGVAFLLLSQKPVMSPMNLDHKNSAPATAPASPNTTAPVPSAPDAHAVPRSVKDFSRLV